MTEKALVMTQDDMERALRRMADEVVEQNRGVQDLIILGIQRRGVFLANRLREILRQTEGVKVPAGELDITLYRDDIALLLEQPIVHSTFIPLDITGKRLLLVDDVLYTGRTVRAALDALMDLGRPASVQLLVLIDRGHRELPIQPDYLGKTVPTSKAETVAVAMKELDGQDRVMICHRDPADQESTASLLETEALAPGIAQP